MASVPIVAQQPNPNVTCTIIDIEMTSSAVMISNNQELANPIGVFTTNDIDYRSIVDTDWASLECE
jgi:hypothetical protein